jgi:hypothetical protein
MSQGGRRPDCSERQGFEVFLDYCQVEFVSDTGKISEPHSFESVVDLQVSKTHLNVGRRQTLIPSAARWINTLVCKSNRRRDPTPIYNHERVLGVHLAKQ